MEQKQNQFYHLNKLTTSIHVADGSAVQPQTSFTIFPLYLQMQYVLY